MTAQNTLFKLSENGEYVVRTYRCSKFKRWFREPVVGFLTITNRRVVFHSNGSSIMGKSTLITEMPLDDVAGLSVYDGLSINWLLFIVFCVATSIIVTIFDRLTMGFLINHFVGVLLVIPFVVLWLFRGNIISREAKDKTFQLLDRIFSRTISRDIDIYLSYTKFAAYIGVVFTGWRLAFPSTDLNPESQSQNSFMGMLILLAIYGFVFLNLFGAYQHTFSLLIGSKSMKDKGIFIPGDTLRLFSTRDTTALQALGGGPAEDAESVIKELGALLTDIRHLGDIGIEKWRLTQNDLA